MRKSSTVLVLALAFLVVTLAPARVLAWGATGHRVVAALAERNISEKAKAAIRELLPPGVSLADVSLYADDVKASRSYTRPWHYVNVPLDQPSYKAGRDCREGDCVVAQIGKHAATLANSRASKNDRTEALKFLVHLVGDLHQPLHCANDGDHGGNDKKVTLSLHVFVARPAKDLHAVWDDCLTDALDMSDAKYLEKLTELAASSEATLRAGTVTDWTNESHKVGLTHAYEKLPHPDSNGAYLIDDGYFRAALPAVDLQLQRAGLRLARLLDEALGGRAERSR